MSVSRCIKYISIFLLFCVSCTDSPQLEASKILNSVVKLERPLFDGISKVIVRQNPDAVYHRDVSYEAYPLSEVLIKAYPDWKQLLQQDAVLVMRAVGGYEPQMPFSDAFSGRVYLATNMLGRGPEQPYDCWMEGGEEHCDLGYFVIWTDGFYPERPQPWGTFEFEVVMFEEAFGDAIPNTDAPLVLEGFAKYRQYCLECHQINFVGGNKATEHVARPISLDQKALNYYLFNYRKHNSMTYMPDFNDKLSLDDAEEIMAYLDHMQQNQNICNLHPEDPRCAELNSE